jgi:hypothetical protein
MMTKTMPQHPSSMAALMAAAACLTPEQTLLLATSTLPLTRGMPITGTTANLNLLRAG